jgi:hypothetical protein
VVVWARDLETGWTNDLRAQRAEREEALSLPLLPNAT